MSRLPSEQDKNWVMYRYGAVVIVIGPEQRALLLASLGPSGPVDRLGKSGWAGRHSARCQADKKAGAEEKQNDRCHLPDQYDPSGLLPDQALHDR